MKEPEEFMEDLVEQFLVPIRERKEPTRLIYSQIVQGAKNENYGVNKKRELR